MFGSWGIFYDIFKLELPRGSFGGDKWIEYYYTLDTLDWPNAASPSGCPPACPGTFIRSTNFRLPSFGADSLEPDLKPMQSQEVHGRHRPRAERDDGGGRALRPQAARSRG